MSGPSRQLRVHRHVCCCCCLLLQETPLFNGRTQRNWCVRDGRCLLLWWARGGSARFQRLRPLTTIERPVSRPDFGGESDVTGLLLRRIGTNRSLVERKKGSQCKKAADAKLQKGRPHRANVLILGAK